MFGGYTGYANFIPDEIEQHEGHQTHNPKVVGSNPTPATNIPSQNEAPEEIRGLSLFQSFTPAAPAQTPVFFSGHIFALISVGHEQGLSVLPTIIASEAKQSLYPHEIASGLRPSQ